MEKFKHIRKHFWYWYKVFSVLGFHLFIALAFTDRGFAVYLAELLAGFLWVSLFLGFLVLLARVLKKPKVVTEGYVPEGKEPDRIEPVKILLSTGHTLLLYRRKPEIDTMIVKDLENKYGEQPLRVWEDILDAYNSKKFAAFSKLKGYCLTKIQKLKQKAVIKGEEILLEI